METGNQHELCQKRSFYIIGHMANAIKDAGEFLAKGVNALEVDIVHDNGKFYVSHDSHDSYENIPTVEEYLPELKALLLAKAYNLSLIIWDMKCTNFNPNLFIAIAKEKFSGGPCDGVAMLMTHSDDHDFVNQYKGSYDNVGVGVDDTDIPPPQVEAIFKNGGQKNFSYADGITTFLKKTDVFKNVTEAQRHRNQQDPGSFSIIYTWVLHKEAAMRTYLDTYIDGIMVDAGGVEKLKELVMLLPYGDVYELAQNGYNPFTSAPLPKYLLTVETTDKFLAGTNTKMLFTLTGSSGYSLKSLTYNGNAVESLEKGSTTHVMLEGMDLGEIKSLTVQALTDGIGAGWLPEKISVESKWMTTKLDFVFNGDDKEEWITKKGGVLIKFPFQ